MMTSWWLMQIVLWYGLKPAMPIYLPKQESVEDQGPHETIGNDVHHIHHALVA